MNINFSFLVQSQFLSWISISKNKEFDNQIISSEKQRTIFHKEPKPFDYPMVNYKYFPEEDINVTSEKNEKIVAGIIIIRK